MIEHPVSPTSAMFHVDVGEALAAGPLPTIGDELVDVGVVLRRDGVVVGFRLFDLRRVDRPVGLAHLVDQMAETVVASGLRAAWADPGRPLPPLTVAICTKDRPERLRRLLRSLDRLVLPPMQAPLDVVVIDNAPSDDATERVVADLDRVRRVVEPKAGLDFARNTALASSRADLIAFLDDDVVVDPGWLLGLWRAWLTHPDAGGFSGLVMPYSLATEAQVLFERMGGFGRGSIARRFGPRIHEASLFPIGSGVVGAGCNMAFDRRLIERIGGFDEALDTGGPLPGGGDLDIFHRVAARGPMGYEPSYAVYHEHRAGLDELEHQYYTWGLGLMAFLDKVRRTDPSERGRVASMYAWWLRTIASELVAAARGNPRVRRAEFVRAELRGAVKGFAGEYQRSVRRSRAIRQAVR